MFDDNMSNRRKAPVIEMQPHLPRIVESLLFLIATAANARHSVTQYDLVKSLFLADKASLNKYGRPITYDNYVAMEHGPVPSTAYDLLKERPAALRRSGPLPWTRRAAPDLGRKCFSYDAPRRGVDEDVLSPSDVAELEAALTVVKSLNFSQTRRLTHEDQAYIDAWEDDESRKQFPMSYALLFESADEDAARHVAHMSKHM